MRQYLQSKSTSLAYYCLTCTTVAAWTQSGLIVSGCRPAAGWQVEIEAGATHVQARGRRRGWLRSRCSWGLCRSALAHVQALLLEHRTQGAGASSLTCLEPGRSKMG